MCKASYLDACTMVELQRYATVDGEARLRLAAAVADDPDICLDSVDEIADQTRESMEPEVAGAFQDGYLDGFDRAMEHLAEQLCNCIDNPRTHGMSTVHAEDCPLSGTTIEPENQDGPDYEMARDPNR